MRERERESDGQTDRHFPHACYKLYHAENVEILMRMIHLHHLIHLLIDIELSLEYISCQKKLPPNHNIHVVICVWMAFNKLINLLAENNTINTIINTLIPHRLYR